MSASSTKGPKLALPLIALVFFLYACQWNVGSVEVHLVYSPVVIQGVARDPLDRVVVRTLRICIEGDGLSPQVTEIDRSADKNGVLPDIPLGKNRVVTVEGLDTAGYVVSRGVSTPFTTRSGNTEVYLYFSLVDEFSPPPSVGMVQDPNWPIRYWTRPTSPRVFHTATLLPDGTVLMAGGVPSPKPTGYLDPLDDALRTIERFDITAGAFIQEPDAPDCDSGKLCMHIECGRAFHSADLLPNNTHVVVAGGEPVAGASYPAEYYSIAKRTFESNIGMAKPSSRHASVVVTGSRQGVLVAGGVESDPDWLIDRVEFFEAGRFEDLYPVIELSQARKGAVAVAYENHVLVIGGWTEAGEASDVVDHISFDTDPPGVNSVHLIRARAEHTAVLLDEAGERKIFVCGGLHYDQVAYSLVDTCELIYPEDDRVVHVTGPPVQRWGHTATVLQGGRVLLAGGFSSIPPVVAAVKSALLFDTPVGIGTRGSKEMVSMRAGHTATLLDNGMVVLVGGIAQMDPSESFVRMATQYYEIFNPRP